MITILIKYDKDKFYSASSFDTKLEKEIDNKPEDNSLLLKNLAKEFNTTPDKIHKFWTTK